METVEKTKNELLQIADKISSLLKEAPKEHLWTSKKRNGYQYYLKTSGKRKYICKNDIEIAAIIARRDYYLKLLPLINKQIRQLKDFARTFSSTELIDCYNKTSTARRLLLKPVFIDDETYAVQWQSKQYSGKKDFELNENFVTQRNESVRSKSEVIIANMLNAAGIPYHYEYPVIINQDITYHPDFFCLNKRTRQEFYWEHCGMMGDPDYSIKLVSRLAAYAKKDIILGKNLILTMETSRIPLSTKDIEKIINTFLK